MSNINEEKYEVGYEMEVPPTIIESFKRSDLNFYCSIKPETRKDKAKIYNMVSGNVEMLSDHIKEEINMVDVAAFPVSVVNKDTGEIEEMASVVILDKNGKCYRATSYGVINSVQKIFAIYGMPDGGAWHKEPVKIKAINRKTTNGFNVLLLDIVE